MTWKNSASHAGPALRTAWTVTTAATVNGETGTLVQEFTNEARAVRYAARVGAAEVVQVERDGFDWKPNTIQRGTAKDDQAARGRWTGRMFTWNMTSAFSITEVELKIDGVPTWVSAD
jgi:hypothetical protein